MMKWPNPAQPSPAQPYCRQLKHCWKTLAAETAWTVSGTRQSKGQTLLCLVLTAAQTSLAAGVI